MRGFDHTTILSPSFHILRNPGAVSRVGRKGGTKVFKYVSTRLFSRLTAPGSPRMQFPWSPLGTPSTMTSMTLFCVLNTKKNGQKSALQIMSLVVYESETNNNFRFVFAILFCVLFSAKLKLSKINKEPSRKLIIVVYYRF